MHPPRSRVLSTVLGIPTLLLVVGCSSGPPAPAPSATAGTATASTTASDPAARRSLDPATPLPELLPEEVEGAALRDAAERSSPEEALGWWNGVASQLGVSELDADDLVGRFAEEPLVAVTAVRFEGADPADIDEAYRQAWAEATGNDAFEEEVIAGKRVGTTTTAHPNGAESHMFWYALGDVLFIVDAPDADVGRAAIELLP